MLKTSVYSSFTRQEKIAIAKDKIRELIDSGEIEKELLLKNGKLRRTVGRRASPLTRYVHRMIQFESGHNYSLPITTQFYMQDFVNDLFGIQSFGTQKAIKSESLFVYILRDGIAEMYDALDRYAQKLTKKYAKEGRLPW